MYRCYACDSPAQSHCGCDAAVERMIQQNNDRPSQEPRKFIGSGEDVPAILNKQEELEDVPF